MPRKDNDVERFRRIRDRQINLRDPQKEVQRLQHSIATKRKSKVKRFSIKTFFSEIDSKWLGLFFGLAFGVLVLVILPYFVEGFWATAIGVAAILFLTILGFSLGQALDARDSLKDLMK
jgi:VIT1/CCC1 family predicted Fe2+/Mn2+ transporter